MQCNGLKPQLNQYDEELFGTPGRGRRMALEFVYVCARRLTCHHLLAMANIILPAKSGNQWMFNEPAGLNISIETVDVPSFFGSALPDPQHQEKPKLLWAL